MIRLVSAPDPPCTRPACTHTHLQCLHELSGTRLGDGSQVVDQVCLGHADPCVDEGQGVVVLVGDDYDLHLFLGLQDRGVSQTLVADLV